MDELKLKALLKKYTNGSCSPEDIILLESWYLTLSKQHELPAPNSRELDNYQDLIWQDIQEQTGIGKKPRGVKISTLWPRIAVAASILVFLSFGLYFYLNQTKKAKLYANDVAAGTNQPVLTFANGQKITLNDKKDETIAQQGAVVIKHNASGQIVYLPSNGAITNAPYNTLTNPRGGNVVSLILSDGTLAKLEAASSITYQTVFTGKTRNVTTTGKVYFSVKYNRDRPFYATTKGQLTEDLGTQFIIDSYDDEPEIKTTLIEGSVSVSKQSHKILLKPGQQTTTDLKVLQADIGHETAWINGDFDFHNQDLHSIMRELTRVYDIDVSYKGAVGNIMLNSMISRSHNISAVLEAFEATNNVHFEINGRRVMVIEGRR